MTEECKSAIRRGVSALQNQIREFSREIEARQDDAIRRLFEDAIKNDNRAVQVLNGMLFEKFDALGQATQASVAEMKLFNEALKQTPHHSGCHCPQCDPKGHPL